MAAPPSNGGQPSAPLSTPRASSQPEETPSSNYSASSALWSTIPGLGSAVKPLEATPRNVSTSGAPPLNTGAPASLRKAPPPFIDAASMSNGLPLRAVGAISKTAGAAPADWQSFMARRGTMANVAPASTFSVSSSAPWSLQGSGGASQSFGGTKTTPASTKGTAVHFTQTEEYHTSAVPASATVPTATLPHTAPLPQTGFHAFSDRTTSERDSSTCDAFTEPTSSEASMGQTKLEASTWMEAANPRSLRHALRDSKAEWEEAFAGALQNLSQLNPAQYLMPLGTRVVNIKTEFPQNILASIREKKYAAIEKVTERIMTVYKARRDSDEKVVFLFSVNGSKKFCGLAEMCGEWDATDSIDGWMESIESAKVKGTIPLKWIYAKDVAYHHFDHIRQLHNGHPVGNMWNGMNFPGETGREVIACYVATSSTSSILGYPRNYPENFGIPSLRGTDVGSDTRSSVSQRSRGSFAVRGAPRGGRGTSRGGLNIPNWRPQSSETGSEARDQFEDDPTPIAPNNGRVFSQTHKFAPGRKASTGEQKTTFSMEDLKNLPVTGDTGPMAGEPVSFVMGQDGQLMVVRNAKMSAQPSTAVGQKSSVFDDSLAPSTRFPPANPLFDREDVGSYARGDHHAAASRSLHNAQPSYADRTRHAGHGHSPSVAMLHQAALFAAHQEARLRNQYPSAPLETSWDYHAQQMASLGFQNNGSHYSRLRTSHDAHMMHNDEDGYEGLQTPTHRPPPHAMRHDPDDNDIPTTYHAVPGWQSEVIQGMGHLQLKALFFTLAAEQHILEYQSMQPAITARTTEIIRARMARIVEMKREVYDELHFIGHSLFNQLPDSQNFDSYQAQKTSGYSSQQRISPIRDENGRPLPSASEASKSPPASWGAQFRPIAPLNGHHQQHSTQSTASMMSGGVQVGERRISS